MATLFKDQPDLLREFRHFLPEQGSNNQAGVKQAHPLAGGRGRGKGGAGKGAGGGRGRGRGKKGREGPETEEEIFFDSFRRGAPRPP